MKRAAKRRAYCMIGPVQLMIRPFGVTDMLRGYVNITDYVSGEREICDHGQACCMALSLSENCEIATYGGGVIRAVTFHNGRAVRFYNRQSGKVITRKGYATSKPGYMQGVGA